MINLKYSQETHDRVTREEGREEGLDKGRQEGVRVAILYLSGKSIEDIARELSIPVDQVKKVVEDNNLQQQ